MEGTESTLHHPCQVEMARLEKQLAEARRERDDALASEKRMRSTLQMFSKPDQQGKTCFCNGIEITDGAGLRVHTDRCKRAKAILAGEVVS